MKKVVASLATLLLLAGFMFAQQPGAKDLFIGTTVTVPDGNAAQNGVTILKFQMQNAGSVNQEVISTATGAGFPTCTGAQPYVQVTNVAGHGFASGPLTALPGVQNTFVPVCGTAYQYNAGDVFKFQFFGGQGCPAGVPVGINIQLGYTEPGITC